MISNGRRRWQISTLLIISLWLAFLLSACSLQHDTEPRWLVLVTTKELDESGLLNALVPAFEASSGVRVKRLPLTTGTALSDAAQAGVDVLLLPAGAGFDKLAGPSPVYPPYQQQPFPTPTAGPASQPIPPPLPGLLFNERRLALWSELAIIAPANDPLNLKSRPDAITCLKLLAGSNARFYGAGPQSEPGLSATEKRLWNLIGLFNPPDRGSGYRQVEGDLTNLLKKAASDEAYTIVPIASFLTAQTDPAIKDKLQLGFQGDKALFLPYEIAVPGAIPNQDRDVPTARSFVAFLTGPTAQSTVGGYTMAGLSHSPYRPYYYSVYVPAL